MSISSQDRIILVGRIVLYSSLPDWKQLIQSKNFDLWLWLQYKNSSEQAPVS